ncbi:hypothetical protein DICPUDRAFT_76613 [Dictyostelium purpureum]|uniref:UPAR/Ly6 domain-containing protein n=1 Tax=Dictyostelium purpureum TaxID=5786 RepID=F0ZE62_DICPU|nr:uncharacterized protein DICPUDRAFT_76613 [Dictyostelium purpureum]EGC37768.1 hypothetical protein DICPUDRAFT_76613 [Dictyostelium purpureum]|eukprot:XP_003285707.1 hypothetical protein DICPUDRAFT_76613 [Dictyostelium purpureum]
MKLIFILTFTFLYIFNLIECQSLPCFNNFSIIDVNNSSCSKPINSSERIDLCGTAFVNIKSTENGYVTYSFCEDNSCRRVIINGSFKSNCNQEQNTNIKVTIKDIEYEYSINCSCTDKSKCNSNSIQSFTESNDYNDLISIPIFVSAIPLLILLI